MTSISTDTQKQILENRVLKRVQRNADANRNALAQIEKEAQNINDVLVPIGGKSPIRFYEENNRVKLSFSDKYDPMFIHPHAIGQIAGKYIWDFDKNQFGTNKMPSKFIREMAESNDPNQRQLAIEILNTFCKNSKEADTMMRSYEGTIKGVLSSKYKRYDSAKIFGTFFQKADSMGAKLMNVTYLPTKSLIEVVVPELIEIDTELNGKQIMAMGAKISDSSYGNGALNLSVWLWKVACGNGLTVQNQMRSVHLGSKQTAYENFKVSNEYYELESKLKAEEVKMVLAQCLSAEEIEKQTKLIQKAGGIPIDFERKVTQLAKIGATKEEVNKVRETFIAGKKKDGCEGEASMWKYINSITAVARDSAPDRRHKLEEIAGNMMS